MDEVQGSADTNTKGNHKPAPYIEHLHNFAIDPATSIVRYYPCAHTFELLHLTEQTQATVIISRRLCSLILPQL